MPRERFLVLRLGSLGDIVHTFPAVAALRESFPSAEIVWLTHPRWKLLVESASLASEVWTLDTRSWASVREVRKRLAAAAWTASVDYQGLWKSAALPFLGGIGKRIGFSSKTIREFGVPVLYTDRVSVTSRHICEQNGELSVRAGAAGPVGAFRVTPPAPAVGRVAAQLAAGGIDRYVVLSPGGGWRSKCWPAERFGALCRMLGNQGGLRCVLNGGPEDGEVLEAVRAASGDALPLPYCGELGELMALLDGALSVVAGDTGPLHLAVALGRPTVALFGPTDPARNGPFPADRSILLRSPRAVTTYRRGDSPDASLLEIAVEEVLGAVLRETGVPHGPVR